MTDIRQKSTTITMLLNDNNKVTETVPIAPSLAPYSEGLDYWQQQQQQQQYLLALDQTTVANNSD